jgi:hypothetical protein
MILGQPYGRAVDIWVGRTLLLATSLEGSRSEKCWRAEIFRRSVCSLSSLSAERNPLGRTRRWGQGVSTSSDTSHPSSSPFLTLPPHPSSSPFLLTLPSHPPYQPASPSNRYRYTAGSTAPSWIPVQQAVSALLTAQSSNRGYVGATCASLSASHKRLKTSC